MNVMFLFHAGVFFFPFLSYPFFFVLIFLVSFAKDIFFLSRIAIFSLHFHCFLYFSLLTSHFLFVWYLAFFFFSFFKAQDRCVAVFS